MLEIVKISEKNTKKIPILSTILAIFCVDFFRLLSLAIKFKEIACGLLFLKKYKSAMLNPKILFIFM
jgi:hypothetical protein